MGLRDTMNNNPAAMTGGIAVVLVLSLVLVVCRFMGGGSSSSATTIIYYDITNKQFKVVEHDYAKMTYPSSPFEGTSDVFIATIWACGECPEGGVTDGMSLADLEAKGMFVGWIEKVVDGSAQGGDDREQVTVYASMAGKTWYRDFSPGVQKLFSAASIKCDNTETQCYAD